MYAGSGFHPRPSNTKRCIASRSISPNAANCAWLRSTMFWQSSSALIGNSTFPCAPIGERVLRELPVAQRLVNGAASVVLGSPGSGELQIATVLALSWLALRGTIFVSISEPDHLQHPDCSRQNQLAA